MTDRPDGDERAGVDGGQRPALSIRARVGALQRRVMREPHLVPLLGIQRAYDHSGGGMLTASLAFYAFFTVVPTVLLLTSLLGFAIGDAAQRAQLTDDLVGQIQPLQPLVLEVVDKLADSARAGTLIGLLGLLWGAAGFYGALEGAMVRMFPGPKARDAVSSRVRGIFAVAFVLTGMLGAVLLSVVIPLVTSRLGLDLAAMSVVTAPILASVVATLVALVVYVLVPPDAPSLRVAVLPALLAGVAIGLLTSLFSFVGQFLVGSYLALGIVGTVFIALVWFNFVFQILLYGAAFARLRRDDERRRAGPPAL